MRVPAHYALRQFASDDDLARQAADLWIADVQSAAKRGERQVLALSGGRIAVKFFQNAAATAHQQRVSFSHVHFFWADERCVPPDHADSNYRVANELLLQPLGVAASQIHRLQGEIPEREAVALASADLCRLTPRNPEGFPVLDLVLLGMGEDGHVASIFPDNPKAGVTAADTYLGVVAAKPPPRRLTLSYGAIAAARAVWVLASGAGKAVALRESLQPGGRTPLGRVLEARASTLIFSDIEGF